MKRIIKLALLYLFFITTAQAEISMQIDAAKLAVGESFRLLISSDDAQAGVPDLTPLQADFDILSTGQSTNYSIINGRTAASNQWTIILQPKRAGTLTIPPLQIGGEQTQAQTIVVSAGQNNAADPNLGQAEQEDVILTAQASESEPYINQQVTYTIRLYNSVRLLDGKYEQPQVENALLMPLGDVKVTQAVEHGRVYEVNEQQYAIFPQKSGKIKITPPKYSALIYDSRPRRVNLSGDNLTLNVKPALPSSSAWFPASQVSLQEQYDHNTSTLPQGSTLIRTITIQATGAPAQLIPKLTLQSGDGFNVYPDKPVEKNRVNQGTVIGASEIKVTYLLNKSGTVTLPAVKLPWFNTETGKEEVATLPELALNITGSAEQKEAKSEHTDTTTQQQSTPKQTTRQNEITVHDNKSNSELAWWVAGGFAAVWLLTLLLWFLQRTGIASQGKKRILSRLKKACLTDQPEQARTALLRWANWQWPGRYLINLADIANLVNDTRFKQEINRLTKALYQQGNHNWQGEALWQCISGYKETPKQKIKAGSLPPINP
ncbi:BatD family protein [Legionella dresdenensis]|uniref:BatD family protein n=1 Tax=Legionella dresdenensis TaxID=450200 RepID=A0ABV8CHV4_9GAMM